MNVSSSTSLNPAMAAMLAQLTPSSSQQSMPSTSAPTTSTPVAVVTGTGKASISDAILDLFSKMHQASGAAHQGGGAGGSSSASNGSTTTLSTASTMIDPFSQLMAAISDDEDEMPADSDPDLSMFYSQNTSSAS